MNWLWLGSAVVYIMYCRSERATSNKERRDKEAKQQQGLLAEGAPRAGRAAG